MIGTIFAFIPIGWDGHSTQAFAIDYGPIEPKSRKVAAFMKPLRAQRVEHQDSNSYLLVGLRF